MKKASFGWTICQAGLQLAGEDFHGMRHKIRVFALCAIAVFGSLAVTICEAADMDVFRDHRTYPGLEPDWWILSNQLIVDNAVEDAQAQFKAGNCRLIAYHGRSYIVPATEEDNFDPEDAKFGLMIVSDSRHGGDGSEQAANTRARAYGGPYNQTVKRLCGL